MVNLLHVRYCLRMVAMVEVQVQVQVPLVLSMMSNPCLLLQSLHPIEMLAIAWQTLQHNFESESQPIDNLHEHCTMQSHFPSMRTHYPLADSRPLQYLVHNYSAQLCTECPKYRTRCVLYMRLEK